MGRTKPRAATQRLEAAKLLSMRRRQERRRALLIFGIGGAVVAALVTSAVVVLVQAQQQKVSLQNALKQPIAGVQTFKNLSRNHVAAVPQYKQNPPVGGDHSAAYLNCGVYRLTVDAGRAVHALEHGAVWVTYSTALPAGQLTKLTEQAQRQKSEILSPYESLPAPIVASAWGLQLKVSDASDPRLATFLAKYQQGPQTPEKGAGCNNGTTQ